MVQIWRVDGEGEQQSVLAERTGVRVSVLVKRVVTGPKFSRWEGGVLVGEGPNPRQHLGFVGGATAVEERVEGIRQNQEAPAAEINLIGAERGFHLLGSPARPIIDQMWAVWWHLRAVGGSVAGGEAECTQCQLVLRLLASAIDQCVDREERSGVENAICVVTDARTGLSRTVGFFGGRLEGTG